MHFKQICVDETHTSVGRPHGFPTCILLVGQRDEEKRILVPLLTFDSKGTVVGAYASHSTSSRYAGDGEYACKDEYVEKVKAQLIDSGMYAPRFLYDVRVGDKYVAVFGTEVGMKLGTQKDMDSLSDEVKKALTRRHLLI